MASKIREKTGKGMTRLYRKIVHVDIRLKLLDRVSIFKDLLRFIWERILSCSIGRPVRYRRLSQRSPSYRNSTSPGMESLESGNMGQETEQPSCNFGEFDDSDSDSDLVSLKISLLGDCQIGKTSFVVKYIGDEHEKKSLDMKGLNLMDKMLFVRGARIAFKIWDVGGDIGSLDQVPIACKDAVAILFMFDLTSRCTLNSVIGWYTEARKWNQTAIPILIGTKFDDFVQLPLDIQWTVIIQARAYARAMKATLFFSSATHNINVNKIFKFIMAKLFNLPWTVERNLTIGEPIIDF
ncbi:OLC1v1022788C1 [Oldenlandia corymbosa var. corymbosa]|uniref:OLC1v1022788C1 n=1 Tax=Oldenlandia corymbosa var. corymbosa TaxID=529605 RepID=A0AAV1BYQ1_OLDCO|nr:OLC1v1022788C1 [Oldenlandia corymbosa var. corymbosa]